REHHALGMPLQFFNDIADETHRRSVRFRAEGFKCRNFPALTCFSSLANLNDSMLETIEKLLVLQDRDRKIHRVQAELAHISPERDMLRSKASSTQIQLDAAKNKVKQTESDRKR